MVISSIRKKGFPHIFVKVRSNVRVAREDQLLLLYLEEDKRAQSNCKIPLFKPNYIAQKSMTNRLA
jgi:hypothetical protein